jgi:hypothetical protein
MGCGEIAELMESNIMLHHFFDYILCHLLLNYKG